MLKWLLAGAPSRQTASVISTDIVTEDPLATISAHKVDRPLEIYAVSRSVSLRQVEINTADETPLCNFRTGQHNLVHIAKCFGKPSIMYHSYVSVTAHIIMPARGRSIT
jgi:hypothetical protein